MGPPMPMETRMPLALLQPVGPSPPKDVRWPRSPEHRGAAGVHWSLAPDESPQPVRSPQLMGVQDAAGRTPGVAASSRGPLSFRGRRGVPECHGAGALGVGAAEA